MISTAGPAHRCGLAAAHASPGWAARPFRGTDESVEKVLRRRIAQRTGGRLHGLEIQRDRQRVIVHGVAPNYYLKQLALAAVQEALPATLVELQVRVARHEPVRASVDMAAGTGPRP